MRLAPASDMDVEERFLLLLQRYMVDVRPPGSGLDIQRGLIITTDVYLRTDMHHDYTAQHHCIAYLCPHLSCDCDLDLLVCWCYLL